MKLLPLILLLCSCSTQLYYPNGQKFARIESNASHISLTGPGIAMEATDLRNSTPTAAAFFGISHALAAAGTAAMPFATGSTILKAAPIIPATVPAFRISPSGQ